MWPDGRRDSCLPASNSVNRSGGFPGANARVLIAQLMLQPADIRLLDEPTNDLDIPTLEILEESLIDFPSSLVLVTHATCSTASPASCSDWTEKAAPKFSPTARNGSNGRRSAPS